MATRNGTSAGTRRGRSGKKATGARNDAERSMSARGRKGAASRKKSTTGRVRKSPRQAAAGAERGRGTASRGKGTSGRSGTRSAQPNAVAMLKEDHDRVQEMFDRFERARSEDQKQQLADRICDELTTHAEIEEEIFYPAVREATGEDDLLDEAEVEHATAKDLIAQIRAGKAGDPQWEAKVKVLGEYVKHHVKEEQKEMFPKARAAKLDLRALGERIAARKAAGRASMPRTEREAARAGRKAEASGEEDESREPGLLESAVRTLLPGGR